MAKARARTVTRKVKDKWRTKQWFSIQAPDVFNKTVVAETLADDPNKVLGRIASTTLQDLTGDFKLMHVKVEFQVHEVTGTQANTRFVGHSLTSDYVRRLVRRNHSKISSVHDVTTKDGAQVRIKAFAVTDRRSQTSQQTKVRQAIASVLEQEASEKSMAAFISEALDGKMAAKIYRACKPIYPLRKVEVFKSEVHQQPTIAMEAPAAPVPVEPSEETPGAAAPEERSEAEPAEPTPEAPEEESEVPPAAPEA